MNPTHDISDLRPGELKGVLVCDALMLRDEVVGINPKRTASVEATGHSLNKVKK
jgi:hypothetical protein